MLSPVMKEIVAIKERLNDIEKRQSDFAELLHSNSRSDIDYMAMELDVNLDQDTEEE